MKYQIQDFSNLQNIGNISNDSMAIHLKLYAGYVNNINTINEKLNKIEAENSYAENLQEYNEMHRRYGWEYNGMKLHEIFFGKLKNEVNNFESEDFKNLQIIKDIANHFGSFEKCKEVFCNVAKIRGFGWTQLVRDLETRNLVITWVNEHDVGLLANSEVLLSIDMLEHAYIRDFGLDRASYLDSVFAHIDFTKI